MGTNQFQREYIEYLQDRNTELLSRLNHLKEKYENKILSKDFNKHYLISVLEDVQNVCTKIPQEIDLFFDKMTAAMSAFKNILLRKSEMVQLMEKISKIINPSECIGNDLISLDNSGLMKEQVSDERVGRRAETVKVSPMINGHIISTEPRIYLSRVPELSTLARKSETHQLSPIIEVSPETSSDPSNLRGHVFREVKIPLERINLNKMSYNYINEESPKSRFKGPRTWKKSLSSNKFQANHQKSSVLLENGENLNKKFSVEVDLPQLRERIDPLEGPSWLYEEIPEINSSSSRFTDYRRRKHRFATVFDKNEDCITYLNEKSKKSLKKDSNRYYENRGEIDDEKDFEENENETTENSEDFIDESFTKKCGNNFSPARKCSKNSVLVRKSNINDSESIKDVREIPMFYKKSEKNLSSFNTSTQWDSSDDENNECNSIWELRKNSNHFLNSSFKKDSMELSVENTSKNTRRSIGRNTQMSKTVRGKKKKKINNVIIKSEKRVSNKEITPKKSKASPVEKKKSKNKCRSPVVFLPDCQERKRRQAAPTFKLVEPKLKTKLRRS